MTITPEELSERDNLDLISSHKIEGTPVINAEDEHVGHVEYLMIDKHSGRAAYAIMSFGGFLGIGEEYHPLPWDVLTYDLEAGGYRVDLTRKELENAPRFELTNEPDWNDKVFAKSIYSHYYVAPYWAGL